MSMAGEEVREIYRAHSGELFGFAHRSLRDPGLAEEAVQETFLRAWKARRRYDPDRASRRTWLFAILRNVVIDMGRSRARLGLDRLDDAPGGGDDLMEMRKANGQVIPQVADRAESEPFERALTAWQLEEALRRIGDRHRQALVETYYRDRPYAELAAELGVPEGTIKSRVYYGLRALRDAMEELGYDG